MSSAERTGTPGPTATPRAAAAPAIAAPGSPRYFAWLYAPPEGRAALEPLFGIEHEIESSLRRGLEHSVAHIRLEWWRGEAARFASGTPTHPLSKALAGVEGGAVRASAELGGLVDGAAWDLATATFETRAELDRHCERWARAIAQPLARATAGESQPALQFARTVGAALREIEMLLDALPDARQGRLRVPLDELASRGVDPDSLARPPWPDALADLVRRRLAALAATLREAVAALAPSDQPPLRALLVWCALSGRRARDASRAPMPPAPAAESRGLREAWTAWSAARGAARGRLRLP